MTTALITGATAGLGWEFARQLAGRGYDLVLVARDADRLRHAASEITRLYGVRAESLPADLSARADLERVERRLSDAQRPVDWLVNNAGYGLRGTFDEEDVEAEQALLDVLVTAPMRLTHAALPGMLSRRAGIVLNVSSVAAFAPRGTYGAAKSWLLSFSRWANLQYRARGVTVTALVPGFVHTEFHDRMRVSKGSIPEVLWLRAPRVVADALRAADAGRAVVIPSLRYKIVSAAARLLPDRIAAAGTLRPR